MGKLPRVTFPGRCPLFRCTRVADRRVGRKKKKRKETNQPRPFLLRKACGFWIKEWAERRRGLNYQ